MEGIINYLDNDGIDITIATVPMLNTSYEFQDILESYSAVFTLEEHYINGGFGTILMEYCNEKNINKKIKKFGIKNEYIHKIGNRDYLRKYYGIDALSIAKSISRELL